MKIVFVTNFFPPTHNAGTENYTYGLARGLVAAGHEVHVLCAGEWDTGAEYWNGHSDSLYDGIRVRRLHFNWTKAPDPNRYLYDNPIAAAYLRDYLTLRGPDVVHVTSCYTLSASVIPVIKDAHLPLVMTLTDYWFLCPRLSLLRSDELLCDGVTTAADCTRCMLWDAKVYRVPNRVLPTAVITNVLSSLTRYPYLTRRPGLRGMALDMAQRKEFVRSTLRMADHLIAPSAFLRDIFVQNDSQAQIEVIRHGHDLSWVADAPVVPSASGVRFGYVGQIAPLKGVHLLVQAFRALKAGDAATLSIFGNRDKLPAYGRRLTDLAARNPNIRFHGGFPRERLGEVMAQIDVLVVPSLWYENSPLTIEEAFAAKKPVIATNLGGMREFVQHEVNGLLFERGDVADLAHQLRRSLEDPKLLERLRAGMPPVKRMHDEVTQMLGVYARVRCDRAVNVGQTVDGAEPSVRAGRPARCQRSEARL